MCDVVIERQYWREGVHDEMRFVKWYQTCPDLDFTLNGTLGAVKGTRFFP